MTTRPTALTPEMAAKIGQEIAADLVGAGEIESDEATACAADIAKHGRRHIDGYELARALEQRCRWSPTAQMVEYLDNFNGCANSLIEDAEKDWAKAHNIQPPLPAGTRVSLPSGETGEITDVYQYGAAKFCIRIDGDAEAAPPTNSRRIVNFESVSAIARAPA